MSRLYRSLSVQVKLDEQGRPGGFSWKGRWRGVKHVANHWRVESNWWDDNPVSRDYYKVLTWDGLLATLYRENEAWFLERIFD